MSITSAVVALACAVSLVPAPTFGSWVSPETADTCLSYVVSGDYYEYMDFDGNGVLDVLDAVQIYKAYTLNLENSVPYTFGESDVLDVVTENLNPSEYSDYFYYEIDFVDGCPCREYEITTDSNITVHVYCEVNDSIFQFTAMVEPAKQLVSVLD